MAGVSHNPEAVRAYLDYFQDLGVRDFYRRDTAGLVEALAASSVAAEPRQVAVDVPPPPVEFDIAKLVSFNDLRPMPQSSVPKHERAAALTQIQKEIGDCTRCPLAYAGRHSIVFADGDPGARLMFVGEGPGGG